MILFIVLYNDALRAVLESFSLCPALSILVHTNGNDRYGLAWLLL